MVNIGIDGMMLASAFFGWFGAIYMNMLGLSALPSLFVGVLAAILTGGTLGLLHAVLSVTYKVDQIIGGHSLSTCWRSVSGSQPAIVFRRRQHIWRPGAARSWSAASHPYPTTG